MSLLLLPKTSRSALMWQWRLTQLYSCYIDERELYRILDPRSVSLLYTLPSFAKIKRQEEANDGCSPLQNLSLMKICVRRDKKIRSEVVMLVQPSKTQWTTFMTSRPLRASHINSTLFLGLLSFSHHISTWDQNCHSCYAWLLSSPKIRIRQRYVRGVPKDFSITTSCWTRLPKSTLTN